MNLNLPFVDIHTHAVKSAANETITIKSLMLGERLEAREADYFSIGIHPWQLAASDTNQLKNELINSFNHEKVIAVGEAGLDRAISLPIDKQLPFFEMQAILAAEIDMPLIIHAVRSFSEILFLKKTMSHTGIWIIHGFSGNKSMAAQLVKHGIYLSIGSKLLNSQHKITKTLVTIPLEFLFFETDQSNHSIDEIYLKAASIMEKPIDELKSIIFANFANCFKKIVE